MGNKFKVMEMNVLFEVQRALAGATLSCSNKWKKHCHMVPCQLFNSSEEGRGRCPAVKAVHGLNIARVQCLCWGCVVYSCPNGDSGRPPVARAMALVRNRPSAQRFPMAAPNRFSYANAVGEERERPKQRDNATNTILKRSQHGIFAVPQKEALNFSESQT